MDCISTNLTYGETGYFSPLTVDYTSDNPLLKPFYQHQPTTQGIADAIEARKKVPVDRKLLVAELLKQYSGLPVSDKVSANINLLSSENCFSVCTAHQPAIFTGSLFFIYKIVHIIKLAEKFAADFPGSQFVPVFYMGSEDADLDELGNIFLNGERVVWDTRQKGAVGKMKPDGLDKLIDQISGQFSVLPYGMAMVQLLSDCYLNSPDIQTATLKLLNTLFADHGLVVLIADNANLKRNMIAVFEEEIFQQSSSFMVEETIKKISLLYKAQASPRLINLFYMVDGLRERIEKQGEEWKVVGTDLSFTASSLRKELTNHPERFSPNVILRGLYQETILPNVAFVGGGGEIAYWLELKELFNHYQKPFPPLIVRNSFLILEEKWKLKLDKLGFNLKQLFLPEHELLSELVKRESTHQLTLADEIKSASEYYDQLKLVAGMVDHTLIDHVSALQAKAIKSIKELEKKLLREEKNKFKVQQRQLHVIKTALFPLNGLQERVDNFMPYYAKWGQAFINLIFDHSLTLEQEFRIITCKAQ